MAVEIIGGAKVGPNEEARLNGIIAEIGGYFDVAHRLPWFEMAWAATDTIKDRDPETGLVKEYPRCFHERKNCYHILRYSPDASALGGEYLCVMHLLDTVPCMVHRLDIRNVAKEGEECGCAPVAPTEMIAQVVAPILQRNRTTDEAARMLAEETIMAKREKAEDEKAEQILDRFEPTHTGRMPDADHPEIQQLSEGA